mgnify:CR=1 FL=1
MLENFHQQKFQQAVDNPIKFVQENVSLSHQHVLRGLHYQSQQPQGKLLQVLQGRIYDVAVDIRPSSPSFGCYVGLELSAESHCQLWIPEGFAHGFLVLSAHAQIRYQLTNYWSPVHEQCIVWNDPQLNIQWPIDAMAPIISEKDRHGQTLANHEAIALP